jgi:DNA polymerase-3 subunit alpha
MGGAIQFYAACKKEEIKPLLAIEAYCTSDEDNKENKKRDNGHLILIAKNNQGYSDLLKLSSEAYLKNFYYKPRIHKQKLSILKDNCICCTACLGSTIAKFLSYERDSYGRAIACSDQEGKAIN